MNVHEIPLSDERVVELSIVPGNPQPLPKWLDKSKSSEYPEVVLEPAPRPATHNAVLRSEYGDVRVSIDQPGSADLTTPGGGSTRIGWLVCASDLAGTNPRVTVQFCHFGASRLTEPLCIEVDDDVIETVRVELRNQRAGFDDVKAWLTKEFTLPPALEATKPRIVHSSGPVDDPTAKPTAFTIHGIRWVADVTFVENRLRVARMLDSRVRNQPRRMRVSEVEVWFADRTTATMASESLRAALAGLSEQGRSYIQMWSEYNQIERESIIEEAARVGWAQYRVCRIMPNGTWQFELSPDTRSGDFLNAVRSYDGKLELEAAVSRPRELGGEGSRVVSSRGSVVGMSASNWTMDIAISSHDHDDVGPPPTGYLFRSLSGDRTRLRRRDEARRRIWSGQAEMAGLALLLEGETSPWVGQKNDRRYDRVLNASVRAAFGSGAPTQSQRKALELALRTPDILLVQGPPGTGKTQFIAALLRCLDGLGEKSLSMSRTLITSFQHDAVDNVANRTRHRGLPPTRVDSRPGRSRQSALQWREETLAKVTKYLATSRPEAGRLNDVASLRRMALSYADRHTSDGDTLGLIEEAMRIAGDDLPSALFARASRMRALIQRRLTGRPALTTTQRTAAARTVRSIRTGEIDFADDGAARAAYAVRSLKEFGLLDRKGEQLLTRAAASTDVPDVDVLSQLEELRLSLLDQLQPQGRGAHTPTYDPEVERVLHEVAAAVHDSLSDLPDGADEVLLAYRADLEQDLAAVEATLREYNSVLAATVQQADSSEMAKVLDAPLPTFDTVIVDEAARANPLDLMIPLACARSRIILVGDHKQLPHVLEQKVERELLRNRDISQSNLATSLFERLFTGFANEEPRVHTIRLDTQFRMHPTLGRFVSETFYDSPTAITAHPSTVRLTHGFRDYDGKVAGWINVPNNLDGESRSGTSWSRRVEARRLVAELKALEEQDRDRQMTFGVITFYKGQQEVLEDELVKADLGVHNDDGEFEPVPALMWTKETKPRERLRVGTVDAFQGMEFDVVLLSITRSSPRPGGVINAAAAIRRYGHLLRDSRMCVAMSRQRRLLIAVGDLAMSDRSSLPPDETSGDGKRSLGEGLIAFRDLCEGDHGVVRS